MTDDPKMPDDGVIEDVISMPITITPVIPCPHCGHGIEVQLLPEIKHTPRNKVVPLPRKPR